ncbi:hypothetical protein B4U79_05807 [Dinothrombium tinctorium]|uniref:Sulfotransferase family protein n=1 Tax=Dinothrombium tinctorium TaxID=1965070 RepID=A0A443R813_9ACAR|nr:hypothetical protein B4U79_05807 [Dinothrombium tinctorium]
MARTNEIDERPIMLWCHPRSVSTAFERAFMQRSDEFECLHEPFGDAYYFGPNRASTRYTNANLPKDVKLTSSTFESVFDEILKSRSGKRVFAKDMAYYIFPHLKERNLPLDKMVNTFLIRDPHKAVPSFYKLSINESTGWGYFDPNEMGYKQLKDLFDFVVEKLKQPPILIDSEDLVKNPKEVMKKYCQLVNVNFDERMISWNSTKISKFDKWNGWHE